MKHFVFVVCGSRKYTDTLNFSLKFLRHFSHARIHVLTDTSHNEAIIEHDRIEKAAKSVDGVTEADWNRETEMLELSYDESKTSVNKVQMAIAEVGHDTPMHKANDDVYDALPGCCQ
ncbi:MAG: heavy-metal-associated domain-containing protein [Bacteroidales bacterium]